MPNEALAAMLADGINMVYMVVDWYISLFSALFGNLLPNSRSASTSSPD